jgi:VanZ family protein
VVGNIRWRLVLPLGYMGALFLLSSIPGDISAESAIGAAFQWVSPNWQNLLHVPLYAGLALSWLWALAPTSLDYRNRLTITALLTTAWGVLDEAHQSFVPGRYPSWTDIMLNLLGGAIVLAHFTLRARATTDRGRCKSDA